MKKKSNRLLTAVCCGAAAAMLAACGGKRFNVEGQIEGAADSVLYFENVGLSGLETLDSVRLGADGTFHFSGEAPTAPEFYRLRIAAQIINVAIDSTETVTIKATYPQMATAYEVTGSDNNQKIKELAVRQIEIQKKVLAIDRNTTLTREQARDSMLALLAAYKEEVKRDYIFKEPNKAYAYFALFQTIGPWLIFDPQNDREDVKAFAAVATSWDTYYPGAERGENLHNIAIEGLKTSRIVYEKEQQRLDPAVVVESGVIDLQLPDRQGTVRSLTALKGQVVLLDFHLFGLSDSPQRILMLRELYNKYHQQGLEIYQVALDTDEHFWKQTTAALPWVCVRDGEGVDAQCLRSYNVQELPEFFLIDRQNNLVKRSGQISDLDAEIKRLL